MEKAMGKIMTAAVGTRAAAGTMTNFRWKIAFLIAPNGQLLTTKKCCRLRDSTFFEIFYQHSLDKSANKVYDIAVIRKRLQRDKQKGQKKEGNDYDERFISSCNEQ